MRSKIPLSDVLVSGSTYARHALRRRLVEEGVLEYKCDICKCPPIWNGAPLSLHLDHVNGVYNDNRVENLRFLCPNCHSQTETYAGKNITGKAKAQSIKPNVRAKKLSSDKLRWSTVKLEIDFTKRGWVNQVAQKLQISPQKVNKWILRVAADDYAELYK